MNLDGQAGWIEAAEAVRDVEAALKAARDKIKIRHDAMMVANRHTPFDPDRMLALALELTDFLADEERNAQKLKAAKKREKAAWEDYQAERPDLTLEVGA